MRFIRLFLTLAVAAGTVFPATAAGGEPAGGTAVWDAFAGRAEETQAEELELRDELIAANLAFIAALDKAREEAEAMAVDDARRPLAWSRVEYLAEASFRLLDDTGEYEAFLKTTQPMALKPPPAPPPVDLEEGEDIGEDDDGGLAFTDAAGKRLLPTLINGAMVLVDAETADIVQNTQGVVARPATPVATGAEQAMRLVEARVAWLRSRVHEKIGRPAEAFRETAALGIIRDWFVLGPLDRDLAVMESLTLGQEEMSEAMDPGFTTVGKAGTVGWRPYSSADPLGRFFAEAIFGNDEPAMAYGLALVYSPVDQSVALNFGSSGPAVLWVNNSLVNSSPSAGLAIPSQQAFNAWLRAGWNAVILKTMSGSARWQAVLRILKPDGSCFDGQVARVEAENLGVFMHTAQLAMARSVLDRYYRSDHDVDLGGLTSLSRWLAANPDDPRANFYLGSLLAARRLLEGVERFDRELIFRRAIELSSGDPYLILMASRAAEAGVEGPDREENLRLLLLKLAVERGSAAALVDMGRLYLDVMRQPRRAADYAAKARDANPMSLRAGILNHDVAAYREWRSLADAELERLGKRHPAAAAVRLRAGRAALERGRFRTALSEFSALLGIDAGNDEALHGAVTALGRLGQTSAAVDLLVKRIAAFPYDRRARLRLADLYRSLGREDEAMQMALGVLAVNPRDPVALAARNDIIRERKPLSELTAAAERAPHPELDGWTFDPAQWGAPAAPPPGGWEFLFFHLEDRMERNGAITRHLSFAAKIYTEQAAVGLRDLDFGLRGGLDRGQVETITIVRPGGERETLTPPASVGTDEQVGFRLPVLAPGDVILAAVEIRRSRLPFLGDYFGQIIPLGQTAPVRLSRYMFTSPRERRLFFQPTNGAPRAMMVETRDGQGLTRIWEMNDLPAYVEEPNGPGRYSLMPCVQISSFGDWDEFSRWYWRLIGTQYHSPPELRVLARRLGEPPASPFERLDRAADWIADNLGNREWEFGPYAFRPISVRAILSRRTADSKDRTLLLCLLAREYGLAAWPVLARSWEAWRPLPGLESMDLPLVDHFNHSLAAVDAGDGGLVFYDPVSANRSPGVMPANLFGAPAVRLTPDGAERVAIPDAGIAGCVWEETAHAVVDPDGSILWEESVKGTGSAAEALRSRFAKEETRDAAWEAFLAGEGGHLSTAAAEFAEAEGAPASASFSGRARLREFASSNHERVVLRLPPLPGRIVSGKEYEFPLDLNFLAKRGERSQDLLLPSAFRLSRRISVAYPREWKLVNAPGAAKETFSFGTMEVMVAESPGGIDVHFLVEVPVRRVAGGDFSEFRRAAALAGRWRRPLLVWEKR